MPAMPSSVEHRYWVDSALWILLISFKWIACIPRMFVFTIVGHALSKFAVHVRVQGNIFHSLQNNISLVSVQWQWRSTFSALCARNERKMGTARPSICCFVRPYISCKELVDGFELNTGVGGWYCAQSWANYKLVRLGSMVALSSHSSHM
jgi:hypothetical protein